MEFFTLPDGKSGINLAQIAWWVVKDVSDVEIHFVGGGPVIKLTLNDAVVFRRVIENVQAHP